MGKNDQNSCPPDFGLAAPMTCCNMLNTNSTGNSVNEKWTFVFLTSNSMENMYKMIFVTWVHLDVPFLKTASHAFSTCTVTSEIGVKLLRLILGINWLIYLITSINQYYCPSPPTKTNGRLTDLHIHYIPVGSLSWSDNHGKLPTC